MPANFFDASGGNPPIYIGSPTTVEEAQGQNQNDSFFGANTPNNNSVLYFIIKTVNNFYVLGSFHC